MESIDINGITCSFRDLTFAVGAGGSILIAYDLTTPAGTATVTDRLALDGVDFADGLAAGRAAGDIPDNVSLQTIRDIVTGLLLHAAKAKLEGN